MLAMVLASMSGTLFIYQGQEIMINAPCTWDVADYRCIMSVSYYTDVRHISPADPRILERALDNM